MPAPRNVQYDNVDVIPQVTPDGAPWTNTPVYRADWRVTAARGGVGVLLLLIGYWLVGDDVREWLRYSWGGWLVIGAALIASLFAIKRLLLVEQPGGFKVFIWNAHAPHIVDGVLRVHQTHAATPFKEVGAYTVTYPNVPQQQPAALIDATPVENGPALIEDRDWLDWIDQIPHLMIAGRTNAGKTTLAEALLAYRATRGELLYVLDPHYQPGKWCGLPATGGGRGFDAVLIALGQVLEEMDRRYKEFDAGKRPEEFDRLTVLIDEVPALVEYCMEGKRMKDTRWLSFSKQLGSEARKVGISVILLTQSPLVEDILINSRMRKNFTRIALGDEVPALLSEERDHKRRQSLRDLLRGRTHAAAMEYRSEIHVLDTDGVPALASRTVAHMARAWMPPQPRLVVSASERSEGVQKARISVPAPPVPDRQTDRHGLDPARKQALIAAMRKGGRTRAEARAILAQMGEGLDNDDWAAASTL